MNRTPPPPGRAASPRRGLVPALLAPIALLAACSSAGGTTAPRARGAAGVAVDPLRATTPLARALPAGTLLRAEVDTATLPVAGADGGTAATPPGARALEGLWREALRQSAFLDVAGEADGLRAAARAVLALDAASGTLTATLVESGQRTHLALVRGDLAAPTLSIDELAVRARLALGDPVATEPVPIASGYSPDLRVVDLAEGALVRLADGSKTMAGELLRGARRLDGGSPIVLEALASLASLDADPAAARAIAQEALGQARQPTPTTQHRLLRSLLLARSSLQPETTAALDRELKTLGLVGQRERPFDPEPKFTTALAHNFLGEFAAAAELLRPLAERMPANPFVRYHLGWAELGLGNGEAAARAFAAAAESLPIGSTVVPHALALYAAGDFDAVHALLAGLAVEPAIANGLALHDLRRMQAALSLLRDRPDRAADVMFSDLAWLLERPSLLQDRAGEVAETGEVLVRLGHGARLRPLLASMQRALPGTRVAEAAAFLAGMAQVAATHQRDEAGERALVESGTTVFANVLEAFGHRQRGELAAERRALAQAARESASPLVKAALVRNLRASGEAAEADALRAAMRREMLTIDLRRKSRHPLLGPELAMAFLVE